MTRTKKILTSLLIAVWIFAFHYESLRVFYLADAKQDTLPKVPFVLPQAGWVMYFNMADFWFTAEVFGIKPGEKPVPLPADSIFETRFPGFSNTRRNMITTVMRAGSRESFCPYLQRKFPDYENFAVSLAGYRKVTPPRSEKEYSPQGYLCFET